MQFVWEIRRSIIQCTFYFPIIVNDSKHDTSGHPKQICETDRLRNLPPLTLNKRVCFLPSQSYLAYIWCCPVFFQALMCILRPTLTLCGRITAYSKALLKVQPILNIIFMYRMIIMLLISTALSHVKHLPVLYQSFPFTLPSFTCKLSNNNRYKVYCVYITHIQSARYF